MNDSKKLLIHKEIAVIGLGKMGAGVARNLHEKGWRVVVWNRSKEKVEELAKEGLSPAYSYQEIASELRHNPRIFWLMLPAGEAVEQAIFGDEGLIPHLRSGDIVIDAGNSFYKDAKRRGLQLTKKGIEFVDVGVSGGPAGARNGACLMVGGKKALFQFLEPLFSDIALSKGYAHFEGMGAGHFVKMVHNGIEYGMMQAIGEGFEVMKKSDYSLDLEEIARIYNTGSVIESRLIGWLQKAFRDSGTDLNDISGAINATGEGEWTVKTAKELGVPVPVIEDSFVFRQKSKESPSYTGQVVSALRGQFGGHAVGKN